MAWDGLYRSKMHYAKRQPGEHVAFAICGRRFARSKTDKIASVNCFACLKKLGVIK